MDLTTISFFRGGGGGGGGGGRVKKKEVQQCSGSVSDKGPLVIDS